MLQILSRFFLKQIGFFYNNIVLTTLKQGLSLESELMKSLEHFKYPFFPASTLILEAILAEFQHRLATSQV